MPVGEVVMVKAEDEGDANDPHKAQVILQLQPISTGFVRSPDRSSGLEADDKRVTEGFLLRVESAETDAAIITVEESAGKRSGRAPGVKGHV